MRAIIPIVVTAAAVLLDAGTGCDLLGDSSARVIRDVPEPDTVSYEALPLPSEQVYYFLFPTWNRIDPNHRPEPLLRNLLDNGFEVEKAWYPNRVFICMNITAAYAAVVQLKKPDARMLDFSYVADLPDWTWLNCGSSTFRQYTFER